MLDSNRFTYAGIFCAVAFFLGALLIVSPKLGEMRRDRRLSLEGKRMSMAQSERSSQHTASAA